MNTLNGYSKSTLSNDYLLTASGGHLPKSDLFRNLGTNLDINTFADNSNKNGVVYINTTTPNDINAPFSYGSILSLNNLTSSWMIACSANGTLSYRSRWWSGDGNDWSDWKTLLTTNGGTLTGTINSMNILPKTNLTYNLGSSTLAYSKTYTRYIDTPSGYDLRFMTGGTEHIRIQASDGALIPFSTGTKDIGSPTLKFKDIYGNLKGNADTATKLGSSTVGSTTTPIYLNEGVPTEIDTKNYLKCLQAQSNLTSSGWYRIGTFTGYRSYLFSIAGSYYSVNSTACSFIINKSHSNITISQIGKASITSMVSKIRLVKDESSAYTIYLDVYNNYNTTTN
jgi:hypothetical protein